MAGATAFVCMTALTGCQEDGQDATWFVEEAATRGLHFVYRSGHRERVLLPEIVGGGAALVDVDDDGDLDAYLVQSGWNLAGRVESDTPHNELFLNDGGGHFTKADNAGAAADSGYGMGVTTGDYDGDGDVDLYVTNLGANRLLQNDGSGRFTDVTEQAGVADPGWGTAAAFADLDADGDLDLFVVNYVRWSLAVERSCFSRGKPTYCAPTAYDAPAMDRLYRNDGNGRFTDVTTTSGLNAAFGNGLGTIAEDFDNDGLVDIFVANDRMKDQLWMNKGDLRFSDEAVRRGVAMDDNGVAKAGMGVTAADVDHDDDVDLLVVNFEGESDSFYRNDVDYFVDVTARAGVGPASRRRTRFGVVLADFDNDGQLDLIEANGKVDGDPHAATDVFAEPNALFQGERYDGFIRFREVDLAGLAMQSVFTSRGVAVGDVDADGRLDLLIANRDGSAQLLMNRTPERSWVGFDVRNVAGSPALGAVVRVTDGELQRRRTVRSSSSYLAAHDPRVHFGLDESTSVENVTVLWPDGTSQQFNNRSAGQVHVLRRQSQAQKP